MDTLSNVNKKREDEVISQDVGFHCHYKSGDKVRIVDGDFAGVEGKVARVAGQQRVVIELPGVCLVATAYIPTAFIKPIPSVSEK